MKINKKIENEILRVINDYWDSYFQGNLQKWAAYLPDDYRNIGTTKAEIWNSKKEIVDFTESVIDQTVGMAEVRNKEMQIIPYDPYVMVHELGDLYVKAEEGWVFYAQFRLSSLLEKTPDGWKILHQHGSYPDSKTEEGEAFAFNELQIENKKLRDAIQARTIELERKNRELEIESALERVRAVAMSMKTKTELQAVGKVIFTELKNLGFAQLRNTEVIINHEGKESITSYYYSDYGVTGIIDVDYTTNPTLKKWAREMQQADDAFAEVIISKKEIKDWRKYRLSLGYVPDPKLENANSVYYYSYSIGLGALSISSFESIKADAIKILEQFRNVFNLAYQRYHDIALAESQAREAQIEAALERVRTRTMGMHSSDELLETGALLFKELSKLEVNIFNCGYVLMDEKAKIGWNYGVNPGDGTIRPLPTGIPQKGTKVLESIAKNWKKQEPLLVIELDPQETIEHQTYVAENMPNFMLTKKELLALTPERLVIQTFNFKHGYLLLVDGTKLTNDQQEMVMRFANVFEQTYIRFLDLKRAEAQAREAQIEAALERVRAKTMAMHDSEGVGECIIKLFSELISLGVSENTRLGIGILNRDNHNMELWTASKDEDNEVVLHSGNLDMSIHPLLLSVRNAWKKKRALDQYILDGKEEIRKYYELLNASPDYPVKINIDRVPDKIIRYAFVFEQGVLYFFNLNPIADELIIIFKRFCALFEQTYRRYLDLVIAERQAREAQVEAALERVRAQTMAMHDSEDVGQCIIKLFSELTVLGVSENTRLGIGILNHDNHNMELWTASKDDKGLVILNSGNINMSKHPLLESARNAWKEKQPVNQFILDGKEDVLEYYKVINAFPDYPVKIKINRAPDKVIHYDFVFEQGILYAFCLKSLPDELVAIFRRFSILFEQTYRRYLDLVRAEKQARESQIEAALERVRARSMAMHHTSELQDVINTVHQQFLGLDITITGGVFISINKEIEDKNEITCWGAGGTADYVQRVRLPFLDRPIYTGLVAGIKTGPGFFTEEFSYEEKMEFFHYLFQYPPYSAATPKRKKEVLSRPGGYTRSCVVSTHTTIFMINHHGRVFTPAENDILKRFGAVFEQSYTRFLDLQKAEVQAREAQIEASLERIRAASMAMHHSEELSKVAEVFLRQIEQLAIPLFGIGIAVLKEEGQSIVQYMVDNTKQDQKPILLSFEYNKDDFSISAEGYELIKKGETEFTLEGKKKRIAEWIAWVGKCMGPKRAERLKQANLKKLYFHVLQFHGLSNINFTSLEDLSAENWSVMRRLVATFAMSYRRFLDLQKAEAQAQESQMEATLERIRAASMAMQHSDELPKVALQFLTQLELQDVPIIGATMNVVDEEKQTAVSYFADNTRKNEPQLLSTIEFEISNYWLPQKVTREIGKGSNTFTIEAKGKQLKNWMEWIKETLSVERAARLEKAGFKKVFFHSIQIHNSSSLTLSSLIPLSDEHWDTIKRMANTFVLSYQRFLDLQKAEAQAREAQIEAALERVRAASMAMHKSAELPDVALVLVNQLAELNIQQLGTSILIMDGTTETYSQFSAHDDLNGQKKILNTVQNRKLTNAFLGREIFRLAKAGEKDFCIPLKGEDLKEFIQDMIDHVHEERGQAMQQADFECVYFYFSVFHGISPIVITTLEPLPDSKLAVLRRMATTFGMSYRRFLDLQKAEAQAKEAQIEAALERVRSRSLAMHQSEELGEVITVVVEQLKELDFSVEDGVALITHIEGSKDLVEWMENPEFPSAIKFHLPYFEHPVLSDLWNAKEDGAEYITTRYTTEESRAFLNHIFENSDFKHTPQEVKDYCLSAGTYGYTIAFQKNTAIFINDYSGYSLTDDEIDIVVRFSKVFEQTYIRFLDLQKAEAQAREAQIEAALERVRSRSMAMHKTDDLQTVIATVFEQLKTLGFDTTACDLTLFDKQDKSMNIWLAGFETDAYPEYYFIPYFDHPLYNAQLEAWENGQTYQVFKFEGALKKSYDALIFKQGYKHLPHSAKEAIISIESASNCVAFMKYGMLESVMLDDNVLTDNQASTLQRFAKVFEQTYTRFLDLQKAEERAWEAQIETALERVRSRSMAMHKSTEIQEVANAVFDNLLNLGVRADTATILTPVPRTKDFEIWIQNTDHNYTTQVLMPYQDHKISKDIVRAWKNKQEIFSANYTKEQKDSFFQFFFDHPKALANLPQERKRYVLGGEAYVISVSANTYTGMYMGRYTSEAFSEMDNNILQRFAKVFEQSYTRFLDLQKAEAQAREAEIELGLERVRARTMAMHASNELSEVVATLYKELSHFGMGDWGCNIMIFNEKKDQIEIWLAESDQRVFDQSFKYRTKGHEFIQQQWAMWRDQRDENISLSGEVKRSYDEYILKNTDFKNLPPAIKKQIRSLKEIHFSFATMKYGMLAVIDSKKLLKENEKSILKRFAKVFQQTYTRFLDLQKAEAQAREAEIEAALERVRSATMAMHRSSDLHEAASILFEQLNLLGAELFTCGFVLCEENNPIDKQWMHAPNAGTFVPQYIPHEEDRLHFNLYKAWKAGTPLYSETIEGQGLEKVMKFLMAQPSVQKNISQIIAEGVEFPKIQKLHGVSFSKGYLLIITTSPFPEEQIFTRFAKVFEQTYTRFLDLQKAEAQAREAQIEAAVERVRAAAMAMHSSDDFSRVNEVLWEQVKKLDVIGFAGAGIALFDQDDHITWWDFSSAGNIGQHEHRLTRYNYKKYPLLGLEIWEAYQKGATYYILEYDLRRLKKGAKEWASINPAIAAEFEKAIASGQLTNQWGACGRITNGFLTFDHLQQPDEDAKNILVKMAAAFELAYQRFLDLQKAEAQAREAQIEAAMERVRAKAMAMQKAEELVDVTILLRKEMGLLGVEELETSSIYIHDKMTGKTECWYSIQDNENEENLISDHMVIDLNDTWVGRQMLQFYRSDEKKTSIIMQGSNRTEWINYCAQQSDLFSVAEFYGEVVPERTYHLYKFSNGYMGAASPGAISAESWNLLQRATKVFSLAYTRFSDLQMAETQAREAQIELALERGRTQSMLMQHSDELNNVSNVFHEQLLLLGLPSEFSYVWLPDEAKQTHMFWATWSETKNGKFTSRSKAYTYPLDKTEPYTAACYEMWESEESVFVNRIQPDEVEEFFSTWAELVSEAETLKAELFPDGLYYAEAYMKYGCFGINVRRPLTEEEQQVLQRFSIEFERAYTRFLDLKKAEARTREAQIEAALEKVRSRTMAMRKADELHEVVTVVVERLVDLGVVLDANGVILCTYFQDSRDVLHWIASPDFSFSGSYLLPYFDHPIFSAAWESKINGDDYFSQSFTVEEKNTFFEYAFEYSDYRNFPEEFKQWVFQNDKHSLSFAWSEHSAILIPSHTGVLPTKEDAEILKRFAKVFEQAYVRFMDLQKAETQAKEAMKQAALDRVRGEIASMRSIEDLNRITPVVWRELMALDVPFIRCGVFIIDENLETVEVYLTTPDGKALGVLHLPFDVNSQTTNTVKHWKEKKVYQEHWDAQTFIDWTQSMIEMGQVKKFTDYQGSAQVPDELHLHFVPFSQGMLYVGDVHPLPEEKIEVVKTLAEAFSIAYARYEDFVKLEQAKSAVEVTLEELKSTQTQLIQSEKMASLGELTAGIAHEIQNPLNFVNNFSEVSDEILDEMIEEIEKGDFEEVKAIATDIKLNLQKISHHGKRADAIVKGMLQHSRKSSGEKTPTDINLLADEYLRLAYHGLRAKDKSFNAAFETDFDPDLPLIKVIPQDVGRVLLNLINNAFQAIQEKRKVLVDQYAPKVTVSTSMTPASKSGDERVLIKIRDNGSGIPDRIKDKIFQPFFTTKPTGEGTGLGLSLSYDIIKAHGGQLEVETKEGEGTTFTILIPINK
jgi:signal transduction histidine kinase/ketosteroid isomerase-like protein